MHLPENFGESQWCRETSLGTKQPLENIHLFLFRISDEFPELVVDALTAMTSHFLFMRILKVGGDSQKGKVI